jgi:hypothetical protein
MAELSDEVRAGRMVGKTPPLPVLLEYLQNGFSRAEIARMFFCTPQAIGNKLRAHGIDIQALRAFKSGKAELLSHVQMRLLESVTDKKIENTGLRDVFTALNIAGNMERLERGQSTSNVSLTALSGKLADLEAAEARLRKQLGSDTDEEPEPPE